MFDMNWRKSLIYFLFHLKGSSFSRNLKDIKKWEFASREQIEEISRRKLVDLLLHSYNNIPYYRKILQEREAVIDGQVRLENFSRIPILTKDIIRKEAYNLCPGDIIKRRPYWNASGGTTGEPVKFIQDQYYCEWEMAHQIYFNELHGLQIGQPEVRLLGSISDILKAKEDLSLRFKLFLCNATLLDGLRMSEESMKRNMDIWNRIKPSLVWARKSSIMEFGHYLNRSGFTVSRPRGIISTAETLTEEHRLFLKKTFNCSVMNYYASCETGSMAWECSACEGLHVSVFHNKIEILDNNLRDCTPGQMGDVYVTALNNYSMPLIRYKIGDTAVPAERDHCSCKRGWPLIKLETGREVSNFITKRKKIVSGIYFSYIFDGKESIKKFQVIQEDYDKIIVLIVPFREIIGQEIQDIESKIKVAMGQDCKVNFKFVNDIAKTRSGKYLYAFSKVQRRKGA